MSVLRLNVITPPTDHMCYILYSQVANKTYIGYTVDFSRRIRQHNGEIVGGAKRTSRWRPWKPLCIIKGFYDNSSALRFEYRLQHPGRRIRRGESAVTFTLDTLIRLITSGDGSIKKNNKMPWPPLFIKWYCPEYKIAHPNVINEYCAQLTKV